MHHLWLWLIIWLLQQCDYEETASTGVRKLLFKQPDSPHKRILQQINIDKEHSESIPVSSTGRQTSRYNLHSTNPAQVRGKRKTDNESASTAILYPLDNNSQAGTHTSSECKRCQGALGEKKVYSDHYQKGTSRSNYMDREDNANYYKSTYPSLTADDENRRNFEFAVDNDGMQNVQLTAVPQAIDNTFNANIPQSLASYIKQASKSQQALQEENGVQQLLRVGNGYHVGSNGFKNTGKESEFNKHTFGMPSNDETECIHARHQDELNTHLNTQTYSHLLSDTSTNPSLQYGLLRSGNIQEYYYPHHDTESLLQKLDGRQNYPLEESMLSRSTLPRNNVYTDKSFPQQTTHDSHQYDNAQTMDSDMYKNRHGYMYYKPEEENEYQDIRNTYTRCSQVNPGLKHNIIPVTNSELTIGHTSEYTLHKPTGTREDITYNPLDNDIVLYPSRDNRRLTQGKHVSQDGLARSPYVRGNTGIMHNTMSITNSDLPPIGYISEYTLKKPTGSSEDIKHNKIVSDILSYLSSNNRRMMQGEFVPQNGLTSSTYVQEPRSNIQSHHPGKPSKVLQENVLLVQSTPDAWQEDGMLIQSIPDTQKAERLLVQEVPHAQQDRLIVQSIPDAKQEDVSPVQSIPQARAKEASTCYNETPDLSSHTFKFLTSQGGIWKKDSGLKTENSMLASPTAYLNKMPTISHTPYFYRDQKEVLNNMDSTKLSNIAPVHHNDRPASPYFIQENKTPSHQLSYIKEINELNDGFMQKKDSTQPLPYIKEINEVNEGLQFIQNRDNTLSHNCKDSTITNVPKRLEMLTEHSKYRVANASPNTDEPPTDLNSINGRNTVITNLPFQIQTYHMTESDNDNLSLPQKAVTSQQYQKISIPSKNMNVESVALQSQSPTSIIQLQQAHNKPKNYRPKDGTNTMKFSVSEKDKCGTSTVTSEITDSSKCTLSTAVPSQNKEKSEIIWMPEEMRSVPNAMSNYVNENYFVPRRDFQKVEPPLKIGTVSGRTKNKYSHMIENSKNDSNSLPASVLTSLEHAHLSSRPNSSISVQARSKSEDNFRQTVNTPVPQYQAKLQESFMETYAAATFPPLVTTVTMQTYLPETYTEMTITDNYKSQTSMAQDVIPTLQSNGDYETTIYGVTKMITSEENMNMSKNSTTELPHGFKKKSSDDTTEFSDSFQYDINPARAEKKMKEKWNVESKQSKIVTPNLYQLNQVQEDAYSTSDATAMSTITDNTTEQTDHSATDLLKDKFRIQFGSLPENTTYQPIMTTKVPQLQDTYYDPSTTRTELLTDESYNYVSDTADINYVPEKRQDEHSTMASTAASSNNEETNPEELVVTEKWASSENEDNFYLSTATVLLPENTTYTVYINTQRPENLVPTHKESLNEFYATTVMSQLTDVKETNENRETKITESAAPKKTIKNKDKVAHKPIITKNAGHARKKIIFESGTDESHETTMAHEFSQNYKEQLKAQDIHKTLKMSTTEKYTNQRPLTSETSRSAHVTNSTALHIPNETNTHASRVSETTTLKAGAFTSEIINGMTETSFPTQISDISQSAYFTTPYETDAVERSTADLHKLNNDNGWILTDGLQYLHTDNYGTSQSAISTTTPFANYNKDKMRSALNAAIDGWKQKDIQDITNTQHMAYFNDTDMVQELITTSGDSNNRNDLDALYFITPTLPPQQNKVTNNYIQLRGTKWEENSEWHPELQNKQDEQSKTGVTSSLPKVQNDTEEQEPSPHHAKLRPKNIGADILCNDTANSQSKARADYHNTKGISEDMQSRNSTTGSMEVLRPNDTGIILSEHKLSEDVTTIGTDSEQSASTTDNSTEYEQTNITRVYTEHRKIGGQHTEHKYLEKAAADLIEYQQAANMAGDFQGYKSDDPQRLRADHKQPKYELPNQYGTEHQEVVTEQTGMTQGESKRTGYAENYHTEAVKPSQEDVTNKTNAFKKTLMFPLQNNDRKKLLLDSLNSDTTSAPSTPQERDGQLHLSKEPVMEHQGQAEALKLAYSKVTPENLKYNSIEMYDANRELVRNVIIGAIKSKDRPPASLPEKKRQAKSSQDIHPVKSERCKIIHTFKDKQNVKYQDKILQPYIPKKEYSTAFGIPSLRVGKSETTHKMNTKSKQNLKFTAGTMRSEDRSDTDVSLAHLPQKSDTRTQRSTCGPWTWYTGYLCMPAASSKPSNHLLLSGNEPTNTIPMSSYETNIKSEPEYDYEMDSNFGSDKTAQELFLNLVNQQPYRNTNVQHSDTLSEEEMMMERNIIHNNDEENQGLPDDSVTDVHNMFDSPQLFSLHTYTDKKGVQPKLYTKRKTNSYHNMQNIPEENYQQVTENSIAASRPVFLGNWKRYPGLLEEIIQRNPSAFTTKKYNKPDTQHLSNVNNNDENTRAFLVFKNREINNESHDDENAEITHSKSGMKKCHQPSEMEILKTRVSQSSSFSEVHGQSREYPEHEDNSEKFITPISSERDLSTLNNDYVIHMFVSDVSHNNIFNPHNNNYKKILLSENMQEIPQNVHKYVNNYRYPIIYHNPTVKENQNNQHNNEIHQTAIQYLLKNNDDDDDDDDDKLHQPEESYDLHHANVYSLNNDNETFENHGNNEVRRTRHAMQYPTTGSSEERGKGVYPKYVSTNCHSYNCDGGLTSELKTATSILKWLKKFLTDTKKT